MSTNNSYSECEKCGGKTFTTFDTRYDSNEEHCLNKDCRFFIVNSGTIKDENPNAFDGTGHHTLEEFTDVVECLGLEEEVE